jgi:hypothetical protein
MAVRHVVTLSLVGVAAAAVAACSAKLDKAPAHETPSEGASTSEGAGASSSAASCTAELVWLQKDAYANTPGRNLLWPPHTTTTFTLSCPDPQTGQLQQVDYAFNNNHGTDPTALDDAGVPLLLEVKSETVQGSQAELTQLFSVYQGCICDPVTTFLSMDSLESAGAQALLKSVASYFQTNLVCSIPGGTDALIQELNSGNIDAAVGQFSQCHWTNGATFLDGLNGALAAFLAGTKETLAGYHVCNNDATLQATLFEAYANTGVIGTCDKSSAICSGPTWFYNPT